MESNLSWFRYYINKVMAFILGYNSFLNKSPKVNSKIKIYGLNSIFIYKGDNEEARYLESEKWFAKLEDDRGCFIYAGDNFWKYK